MFFLLLGSFYSAFYAALTLLSAGFCGSFCLLALALHFVQDATYHLVSAAVLSPRVMGCLPSCCRPRSHIAAQVLDVAMGVALISAIGILVLCTQFGVVQNKNVMQTQAALVVALGLSGCVTNFLLSHIFAKSTVPGVCDSGDRRWSLGLRSNWSRRLLYFFGDFIEGLIVASVGAASTIMPPVLTEVADCACAVGVCLLKLILSVRVLKSARIDLPMQLAAEIRQGVDDAEKQNLLSEDEDDACAD